MIIVNSESGPCDVCEGTGVFDCECCSGASGCDCRGGYVQTTCFKCSGKGHTVAGEAWADAPCYLGSGPT